MSIDLSKEYYYDITNEFTNFEPCFSEKPWELRHDTPDIIAEEYLELSRVSGGCRCALVVYEEVFTEEGNEPEYADVTQKFWEWIETFNGGLLGVIRAYERRIQDEQKLETLKEEREEIADDIYGIEEEIRDLQRQLEIRKGDLEAIDSDIEEAEVDVYEWNHYQDFPTYPWPMSKKGR